MKVLISGGSGLVGREISRILIDKGHQVGWLSRNPAGSPKDIQGFYWDPDKMEIDLEALNFADAIIHLAGANIAKRWTPHYKDLILRSRVDGTHLLFEKIRQHSIKIDSFISASAVGYYPNSFDALYTEESAPGDDYLSLICQKWEAEVEKFEALGIRSIRMRIGIVLDSNEGALAQMAAPLKWGFGAPLGTGNQWMPWIHRFDLASMFVHALENTEISSGVYNAVGPENLRNKDLTKTLAKVLNRPLFLPPVPEFVLKLYLGEMSAIALASTKCSNAKIVATGFEYRFSNLEAALKDLYLA